MGLFESNAWKNLKCVEAEYVVLVQLHLIRQRIHDGTLPNETINAPVHSRTVRQKSINLYVNKLLNELYFYSQQRFYKDRTDGNPPRSSKDCVGPNNPLNFSSNTGLTTGQYIDKAVSQYYADSTVSDTGVERLACILESFTNERTGFLYKANKAYHQSSRDVRARIVELTFLAGIVAVLALGAVLAASSVGPGAAGGIALAGLLVLACSSFLALEYFDDKFKKADCSKPLFNSPAMKNLIPEVPAHMDNSRFFKRGENPGVHVCSILGLALKDIQTESLKRYTVR